MAPIQQITLGEIRCRFRIAPGEPEREIDLPEVFVDGAPLSARMGVRRGLAFASNDLAASEPELVRLALATFMGRRPPDNQLGSGRVVLYRCHCGCDHCGVISFALELDVRLVRWRALSVETDDGVGDVESVGRDYGIARIEEIAFDRAQYETELSRYAELRGASIDHDR